ncbi:MAG TPA: hypothetical protein VI704_03995 [Bacteroidota bacterium]|nr:hypothetical protein [Bacteroidota bacterium]
MRFLADHKGLLFICGFFLLLGILRLNDLSLYTDSTRYVIWGTSFAQLKGFVDDTQPEPDRYVVNAPFYAVLLSPPMVVFPMSMYAAKTWTLLWGVCALVLFHIWLLRMVGTVPALFGTLVLAVNPLMLVISTEALSEASFLAFAFFIFILFDRIAESSDPPQSLIVPFLVCVSLIAVLREVAITLLGALFVALIIRKKAKYAFLMLSCAAGMYAVWMLRNLVWVGETPSAQSSNVNFIFQHALTSPDAPLHEEFLARIRSNVNGFGIQLAGMLFYPFPPNLIVEPGGLFRTLANNLVWGKYLIAGLGIPLVVFGIVLDFRKSQTALVRFLFLLFYFMVILTYPIHDIRFLLPALPFMIVYATRSVVWLMHQIGSVGDRTLSRIGFGVLVAVMVPDLACDYEIIRTNLSYRSSASLFYEHIKKTNPEKTYFNVSWGEVGSWMKENTPENAVTASSSKEPATFVGNRKILEINNGVPLPLFEFMIRDHDAEYVLANGLWSDFTSYEFHMRESHRFWFEPVSTIGNLHVFKVRSRLRYRGNIPQRSFEYDTVSPTGWLRKGRLELITENYRGAIYSLGRAAELQPNQPEPAFQLFLAHAFVGDSSTAIRQIQKMFTIARSTPYIWAAQIHLSAMNQANQSKTTQSVAQKSVQLFDVAQLYWKLGYRKQGYRIMREVVKIDPTYFVGLLWAWHYGIQSGDTLNAITYLRTLSGIDRSNAVVKSFKAMSSFSDTLRRASKPAERSRLRLLIAQEYEKMELPEDAIDETERSLVEDARNTTAWSYLGELFSKKKKPRAATKAFEHVLALDPGNVQAKTFLSQSR